MRKERYFLVKKIIIISVFIFLIMISFSYLLNPTVCAERPGKTGQNDEKIGSVEKDGFKKTYTDDGGGETEEPMEKDMGDLNNINDGDDGGDGDGDDNDDEFQTTDPIEDSQPDLNSNNENTETTTSQTTTDNDVDLEETNLDDESLIEEDIEEIIEFDFYVPYENHINEISGNVFKPVNRNTDNNDIKKDEEDNRNTGVNLIGGIYLDKNVASNLSTILKIVIIVGIISLIFVLYKGKFIYKRKEYYKEENKIIN